MTSRRLFNLAVANDDAFPDWTCPGCGQDIVGWRDWQYHYPPGRHGDRIARAREWPSRSDAPWPFAETPSGKAAVPVCPWDRDMLTARVIRRRLIREGITR